MTEEEMFRQILEAEPLHSGTKPGHFESSIIHFPTIEGMSEVSERASKRVSAAEGASAASSPEQANE